MTDTTTQDGDRSCTPNDSRPVVLIVIASEGEVRQPSAVVAPLPVPLRELLAELGIQAGETVEVMR